MTNLHVGNLQRQMPTLNETLRFAQLLRELRSDCKFYGRNSHCRNGSYIPSNNKKFSV